MQKTLLFAAALASAALTANATTLVDSWTVEGGAWNYAAQPYASSKTINADTTSATLVDNVGPEFPASPGSHLIDIAYYSFSTAPVFTLNSGDVLEGVNQISLEIHFAGVFTAAPTLNFGSATNMAAIAIPPVDAGDIFGSPAKTYIYTWDVSALNASSFSINFEITTHDAFDKVVLTQTAVPEPSTYAMILGGLGLAAVVAVRRRRA